MFQTELLEMEQACKTFACKTKFKRKFQFECFSIANYIHMILHFHETYHPD